MSNMWENAPEETKYIFRNFDGAGDPLDGHNSYPITFPKGEEPQSEGSGR